MEKLNPTPILPADFRPFSCTFTVDSIEIFDTRSAHLDSDKLSVSAAVGDKPAQTVTKDLGDKNNGTFPVGLSVGPVSVETPEVGVAFNYLVLNAGHQTWTETDKLLKQAGDALASQGAKAATAAIGAAVGATVGTTVLPVIGSLVGALVGWLVGELDELIFANCDGPVAAEQPAFKGAQLWAMLHQGPFHHYTYHPGVDSPAGCGANSRYGVNWTIARA